MARDALALGDASRPKHLEHVETWLNIAKNDIVGQNPFNEF
jgi:hypothetical protein